MRTDAEAATAVALVSQKNLLWLMLDAVLYVFMDCLPIFFRSSVSLSLLLPCFLVLSSSSLAALKLKKCFCLVYPVSNNFICTEDPSYSEH